MSQRPRVVLLGSEVNGLAPAGAEMLPTDRLAAALARLGRGDVDALLADAHAPGLCAEAEQLLQAAHVLETLDDGVAVLDADLRILWANATFRAACPQDPRGQDLTHALAGTVPWGTEPVTFAADSVGSGIMARMFQPNHCRFLDVRLSPLPGDGPGRFVALTHDVTSEVTQRQKLDALHQAGRELADLAPDQIAEMNVAERIEVLKQNLRRSVHDLLRYDVIEIRLLNPATSKLEPLLEDGMLPEAAARELFARPEGNGVTGLVAATGRSYLCPDTSRDPHYLEGSPGARSSMTVPLMAHDQVIGTLNVESPQLNAFTAEDVRFTELFSREIAQALNTLQLLSAQQTCTASQSIEAINREVALPVDELLAAATSLLARTPDGDTETAAQLRKIVAAARSVKQCIQKVGEDLSALDPAAAGAAARLKGMRVLVADNDERVRRSAHGILGRFGCDVEAASTGLMATAMAGAGGYDAALIDIRLPDLSGYEAYRRLRDALPKARLILMTGFGYDGNHSIVKARQDGLRFVLYKPFRVDQLLDALISPEPPSPADRPPQVVKA